MRAAAFLLLVLAGGAAAAEFPAVLEWSGRVQLTLSVPGVLEQVKVQAGQTARKGELLASLHPALYQAAVAEARADLERHTQEEADARRDLDRVKELYARTVAATSELDAAALRHARARAALAATQARLEKARRQLAESELLAPFDLLILARHGEPGQVITIPCQPAPVVTAARADEWLARAILGAPQASRYQVGEEAEARLGERTLKGRIQSLTALADGRYQMDVALPRVADSHVGQAVTLTLR